MHDHGDVGRLFFRRYTDALHIGRENGERDGDADDAGKDRPVDKEVRKIHSNAECGIWIAELLARLRRAVLMEATGIAISSSASCLIAVSFAARTRSDSSSNSSQNNVSSASSSTMPILAMKSAVDFARQAAR